MVDYVIPIDDRERIIEVILAHPTRGLNIDDVGMSAVRRADISGSPEQIIREVVNAGLKAGHTVKIGPNLWRYNGDGTVTFIKRMRNRDQSFRVGCIEHHKATKRRIYMMIQAEIFARVWPTVKHRCGSIVPGNMGIL